MNRKDFTPALLSFALLLGIIVLGITRTWRVPGLWLEFPVNMDSVFVCLYVLWVLIEAPIARRDTDTGGKKTSDFATCQLYAFGQALTFLSALWFPSCWHAPNIAHLIGISLFLAGVCYRLWAIRTLGMHYSHRVRILDRHRIVASGPYRFMRHPAYAGMIVANAGISIYFLNWATLGFFLLALVPAILLRMVMEERVLFGIEGYADFAGRRKRLIPGIW